MLLLGSHRLTRCGVLHFIRTCLRLPRATQTSVERTDTGLAACDSDARAFTITLFYGEFIVSFSTSQVRR